MSGILRVRDRLSPERRYEGGHFVPAAAVAVAGIIIVVGQYVDAGTGQRIALRCGGIPRRRSGDDDDRPE